MLVDQPTGTPTNKVAAAGIGGAIAVVLVWVTGLFGVDMPGEVAAAFTVILAFAAGYFTRERSGQGV